MVKLLYRDVLKMKIMLEIGQIDLKFGRIDQIVFRIDRIYQKIGLMNWIMVK